MWFVHPHLTGEVTFFQMWPKRRKGPTLFNSETAAKTITGFETESQSSDSLRPQGLYSLYKVHNFISPLCVGMANTN